MNFKFQTAQDYKYGNYHITVDKKAAFHLLLRTELYESNYKPAICQLATCYMKAEGTSKDAVKAKTLYKEAFDTFNVEDYKDDQHAQYALAYIYNQDFCPTGKDDNKSKELYALAASQGNVMASMNLGLFHLENNEIDQAIKLIIPAVLLGNSLAENNLSVCIDKKTNPDHQEFLRLLRSSIAQGNDLAKLNLAFEYYYGNKVDRDITTSNELLTSVINNTNPTNRYHIEAFYQLGVNCLTSIETTEMEEEEEEVDANDTIESLHVIKKQNPVDWARSIEYFKCAAKKGHIGARMQIGIMCMADKTPKQTIYGMQLLLTCVGKVNKPASLAACLYIFNFCSQLGEESPLVSDFLGQLYQCFNNLMLEMDLDDDKMFTLLQKQRLLFV